MQQSDKPITSIQEMVHIQFCPKEQVFLLRSLQTLMIVLLCYGLGTYILQIKISEGRSRTRDPFQTELINRHNLQDPPWNQLIDISNFAILISPSTEICRRENVLFFIVVHSKPNNFEQRRIIRSSWGRLKEVDALSAPYNQKWYIKLIFVLGETSHRSHIFRKNVETLIRTEAKNHSDILQGSFPDKYHNLVYKHILSIKCAYRFCANAKFVIKADDDAFIDLHSLHFYLERTLGPLGNKYPTRILAGNVFPAFTAPQRIGKWAVSRDEYPWDSYPSYLGGLAYVMTPDVSRDLSRAAYTIHKKPLWVDDVFITGIVAHSLDLHPLHLNTRYVYDHEEISRWYQTSSQRFAPPFTFAHMNTSQADWKELMQNLWIRVSSNYEQKQLIINNSTTSLPI